MFGVVVDTLDYGVKAKCGINKIGYKTGKAAKGNLIRSRAEKLVLNAFKALEII